MPIDRLHGLLQRFPLSARLFHSGPLCGITDFPADADGQLHLVRDGRVQAFHGSDRGETVDGPALLFYPRPLSHRLVTDADRGADMACARVHFAGGAANPVSQALPPVVVLPLDRLPGAADVLALLFEEAFAERCGRQDLVDRLFEVVVILVLRALMADGAMADGLLAGMAHPKLARALTALHDAPARPWTLPMLADVAGMSRSQFAARFRERVGVPPAEYVARYRMALTQQQLRRGRPLKQIADEVGYAGTAALSRAFSTLCGCSPRAWLRRESVAG